MGLKMKEQIKKFEQPGPLAAQVDYTVKTMLQAGCTDKEIVQALKSLCTADIDKEIYE